MKIIELDDRIIYRAEKEMKVKFVDSDIPYSEISVNKDDERVVVEVDSDV